MRRLAREIALFPVRLVASAVTVGWWLWLRLGAAGVWLADRLLMAVIRLAAMAFGLAAVVGRWAERRLMARGWVPMAGSALRYRRVGVDSFVGMM